MNYVKIEDAKQRFYMFKCNRWLDRKEDDGQIERILHCDVVSNDEDIVDNQNNKSVVAQAVSHVQAKMYVIQVYTGDFPKSGK